MKRKARYKRKPGESRLMWKEHLRRKSKKSKWEKRISYACRNMAASFQILAQRISEYLTPAFEKMTEALREIAQNGLEETE